MAREMYHLCIVCDEHGGIPFALHCASHVSHYVSRHGWMIPFVTGIAMYTMYPLLISGFAAAMPERAADIVSSSSRSHATDF